MKRISATVLPLAAVAALLAIPAAAFAHPGHAGHDHTGGDPFATENLGGYEKGERDFYNAIRVGWIDMAGSGLRGHGSELMLDATVVSSFRLYYSTAEWTDAPLGAFNEKAITLGLSTGAFGRSDPLAIQRELGELRPYFFDSDFWIELGAGQLTRGEGAIKSEVTFAKVTAFASWGAPTTNAFASQWQVFLLASIESKVSGDFDFQRIALTAGGTLAMGFHLAVSFVSDSSDAIDGSYLAVGFTVGVPTLLGGLWSATGKETSSPR